MPRKDSHRYGVCFVLLNVYDPRVDMRRMCADMDDVVFLYGLTYMIERGLNLIQRIIPKKGEIYGNAIREYFCGEIRKTDEEEIYILPEWISRRKHFREKKETVRWDFFEAVVPQVRLDAVRSYLF